MNHVIETLREYFPKLSDEELLEMSSLNNELEVQQWSDGPTDWIKDAEIRGRLAVLKEKGR